MSVSIKKDDRSKSEDGEGSTGSPYSHYLEWERPDCSRYASYSRLRLPYEVICRKRYAMDRRSHGQAFLKEMKMTELLHPTALPGVRLYRIFLMGIVNPPLLTKKHWQLAVPDPLDAKQRTRLAYMFRYDVY